MDPRRETDQVFLFLLLVQKEDQLTSDGGVSSQKSRKRKKTHRIAQSKWTSSANVMFSSVGKNEQCCSCFYRQFSVKSREVELDRAKRQVKMTDFCTKNETLKAEILWTLKIVNAHNSFRSCEDSWRGCSLKNSPQFLILELNMTFRRKEKSEEKKPNTILRWKFWHFVD